MVLRLSTGFYIVSSVFAGINGIVRSIGIQAEQALAVRLQVAEQELSLMLTVASSGLGNSDANAKDVFKRNNTSPQKNYVPL